MKPQLIISTICFTSFLLLAACTAVPQPTATPEAITNLVTPTQIRPSATSTATPFPTTAVPEPTERIPLEYEVAMLPPNNAIVWSPIANELLFNTCPDDQSPLSDTFLYVASSPNFLPDDITPKDVTCRSYSQFLWHPDGQRIVFDGLSYLQDNPSETDIWIMDRTNSQIINFDRIDRIGRTTGFVGWMDNDILVYSVYSGGGHSYYSVLDISKNEEIGSAYFHAGGAKIFSNNLLVGETGATYTFDYSAVIMYRNRLLPTSSSFGSPHLHFLSSNNEGHREVLFNSQIASWSFSPSHVLVLTWDKDVDLYWVDLSQETSVTDLQLWNIEEDNLTLIAPDSVYGNLSKDGQFLLYITSLENRLHVQLMDVATRKILLSNEVYTEGGLEVGIWAFTSFSPNGRFLTYYSPEQDLVVYDIALGTFLPSVTAVPFTPIWSPDNGRFVYKDPDNGLSIYEIDSQTTYSLTQAGCDELRNPQWSFAGTYLSVDVPCGGTAVLQLP